MTFFGPIWGQDLENRAAYPRQEFPGVPPPPFSSLDLYEVSEKSLFFQYKWT